MIIAYVTTCDSYLLTVTLGKFHLTKENEDIAPAESEEEINNRILKHERSAAAFLCRLLSLPDAKIFDHPLTKDVVGIVATLGKVDDGNLSRLVWVFFFICS